MAAVAHLWRALEDVIDPEFPISVVDMGLIYGITKENDCVRVELTFTSTGCPCMEWIMDDIQERLLREPDVGDVELVIVWDPPWTVDRLTKRGGEILKQWGVSQ